ncbi:cell division membrane protein [Ligilactobacillus salitolerans]|uniref:Cell division membrane protein n=1 Tax=Ligilactobacillus salitolerans TaxID=1808352 RepID=A0A401IR05_9LACO|nr:YggT family protein [Ligilactobacillus salitolerans]GBG93942.1 cell division membrane protein [Ligilactobacillus salitolerans]
MLLYIISGLFQLYSLAILVYVLMSWFPGAYQTSFGGFLGRICEPYLSLFNFIPPIFGISFAPWVALIVLELVERGLMYLLAILGLGVF